MLTNYMKHYFKQQSSQIHITREITMKKRITYLRKKSHEMGNYFKNQQLLTRPKFQLLIGNPKRQRQSNLLIYQVH